MITFSIVQKSQLEGALRLDAEFYCVPNQIKGDFVLGKDAVEFVQYGTSKELNEDEKGFPVLRLNEFDDFFITTPSKYCEKINKEIFENLKLKADDVLICRTNGNPKLVGRSAVVLEDKDIAFASYLFRVRPKKEIISPESLTTFLNSKIGRTQIERFLMPSIQSNFSPAQFRAIRIPLLPKEIQNNLDELVRKSSFLRNESLALYSQAEELFLGELGLKDFELEDDLSYIVNLSEIKSSNRADAEYFQPKHEKLNSKLKLQDAKSIEELFSIRRGDFINPNYYVEKAKRAYIRIKELPIKGDLNVEAVTYINDSFKEENIDTLRENDFVFAGIGATLGKVAKVPKELEGSFYSNNTARFRLKKEYENKLNPEYAEIVLQSMVCQLQFEQRQAQTAQAKIADEELQTVLIPILPKETQEKIADLVHQSHESRKKAKELLEEAKYKVEQMIENQTK